MCMNPMGGNGRDFNRKYLPSQVGRPCASLYNQQKNDSNNNGGSNNNRLGNGLSDGGGGNNNGFRSNNKQNNNRFGQHTHQDKMATQMQIVKLRETVVFEFIALQFYYI